MPSSSKKSLHSWGVSSQFLKVSTQLLKHILDFRTLETDLWIEYSQILSFLILVIE